MENIKQIAQNHILHAIDVRIDMKKAEFAELVNTGKLTYSEEEDFQKIIEQIKNHRELVAGMFRFFNHNLKEGE